MIYDILTLFHPFRQPQLVGKGFYSFNVRTNFSIHQPDKQLQFKHNHNEVLTLHYQIMLK